MQAAAQAAATPGPALRVNVYTSSTASHRKMPAMSSRPARVMSRTRTLRSGPRSARRKNTVAPIAKATAGRPNSVARSGTGPMASDATELITSATRIAMLSAAASQ